MRSSERRLSRVVYTRVCTREYVPPNTPRHTHTSAGTKILMPRTLRAHPHHRPRRQHPPCAPPFAPYRRPHRRHPCRSMRTYHGQGDCPPITRVTTPPDLPYLRRMGRCPSSRCQSRASRRYRLPRSTSPLHRPPLPSSSRYRRHILHRALELRRYRRALFRAHGRTGTPIHELRAQRPKAPSATPQRAHPQTARTSST